MRTYCVYIAYIFCTYCVHIAYISRTYCVHIMYILCTYRVHIAYILCTYCVKIVYILLTYCVHIVYILCTYCLHFVYIFQNVGYMKFQILEQFSDYKFVDAVQKTRANTASRFRPYIVILKTQRNLRQNWHGGLF